MRPLNVFLWHVHGSYTTALVQGQHTYLLPRLPGGGPYGLGRAETWEWPDSARNVSPSDAASMPVDVVVLQRPEEVDLAEAWLGGRRPGRDIPAVYLEHNAPQGRINDMRHPCADRSDLTIVHVTDFNALFWDTGSTPVRVIDHGVLDVGHIYSGTVPRAVSVINEPVRRARVTGTDILPILAERSGVDIDLFGMKSEPVGGRDVSQAELHSLMAEHRVYLHPVRWTSLGLSLLEAMTMGMPVVALATTEVATAVPPGAGVVSNDLDVLAEGLRQFVRDEEAAHIAGKVAREAALSRFGLGRFLEDWNRLLTEVTDS